jgi:hypothetical protein
MSNIDTATRAKQLSMACGVAGINMPPPTADLVLELFQLIKEQGDKVSIGDINRTLESVSAKYRQPQMIKNETLVD